MPRPRVKNLTRFLFSSFVSLKLAMLWSGSIFPATKHKMGTKAFDSSWAPVRSLQVTVSEKFTPSTALIKFCNQSLDSKCISYINKKREIHSLQLEGHPVSSISWWVAALTVRTRSTEAENPVNYHLVIGRILAIPRSSARFEPVDHWACQLFWIDASRAAIDSNRSTKDRASCCLKHLAL